MILRSRRLSMFGENQSESARLPSPWETPKSAHSRHGTPASGFGADLIDSSLSDVSLFDTEPSSVDEAREALAGCLEQGFESCSPAGDGAVELSAQQIRRRKSDIGKAVSPARRLGSLSPESDLHGQVEYKLKLTSVSQDRFNRLTTQLKWRLLEGGGESYYELGVLDDGTLVGLRRSELVASLKTLERMAEELGATVLVVKEIRLPTLPSGQLDVGDSAGSRKRWERFQAGLAKIAATTGPGPAPVTAAPKWASPGDHSGVGKRRYVREKKWQEALAQQGGTSSSMATTSDSASTPGGGTHSESAGDQSSTSLTGLTDELTPFTKSQSRSVNRKKYGSILDDAPTPADRHSTPLTKSDKPFRRPRKPKGPATARAAPEEDAGSIFGVFDLDLSDPFSPTEPSLPPLEVSVSAKKTKEENKAAKKKAKKASMASPALIIAEADGDDGDGWAGQSLDLWGADGPPVDNDVAPLSLGTALHAAASPQEPGSVESSSTRPAETPLSSTPQVSSDSLTPSPSPLLVPTYRPPPSLLPRAFPARAEHDISILASADGGASDDALDEDGTERLCVEVLVCRKDMENYLNLEDFGRWDVETVLAGDEPEDC